MGTEVGLALSEVSSGAVALALAKVLLSKKELVNSPTFLLLQRQPVLLSCRGRSQATEPESKCGQMLAVKGG